MRHILLASLLVLAATLTFALTAYAQMPAPKTLAGFTLGNDVSEYKGETLEDSGLVLWDRPFLSRVQVKPKPGFRSGYLTYGNCAKPGRIVRIKMSYADESLEFFKDLYHALQDRYGKNPEWRGDAFGTLRTWKWGLNDEQGNSVSIILQYYSGDDDTNTPGNSIRIAVRNWMEAEEQCYKEQPKTEKTTKEDGVPAQMGIDYYLPK